MFFFKQEQTFHITFPYVALKSLISKVYSRQLFKFFRRCKLFKSQICSKKFPSSNWTHLPTSTLKIYKDINLNRKFYCQSKLAQKNS